MVLQKCTTPELENSEKYKIRQLESLNTTGQLISSLWLCYLRKIDTFSHDLTSIMLVFQTNPVGLNFILM